jgi:casein kinase I family protein HRR25
VDGRRRRHKDKTCTEPGATTTRSIHIEILHRSGVALENIIASGSFGALYKGTNTSTGQEVAVKVESESTRCPQLKYEARVLKFLSSGSEQRTQRVHWLGVAEHCNVMVMDLLGLTLEGFFVGCSRRLPQSRIALLGSRILESVQYLHSKGFIHRNLNPQTISFHPQSFDKVYLVDLGLTKKYTDKTQDHIAFSMNKSFLGDITYASVRTHFGLQQSRRDDLESLVYILWYLSWGWLPWSGLDVSQSAEEMKSSLLFEAFLPKQLLRFLRYTRGLSFTEAPDYSYLEELLQKHLAKATKPAPRKTYTLVAEYDFVLDWTYHPVSKGKLELTPG